MPSDLRRSLEELPVLPLLADALSTALFLMDREAGSKLARELGAEALWILPDGSQIKTGGFPEFN